MTRSVALAVLGVMLGGLSACQVFRDTDAVPLESPDCVDATGPGCGCDTGPGRTGSSACPSDTGDTRTGDTRERPPDADTAADTPTPPSGPRSVDCSTVDPGVTIAIDNRTFIDGNPEVAPGAVVRWQNEDDEEHTVVSGEYAEAAGAGEQFDSGPIPTGGTFCVEFSEGAHPYFCRIRGADEMSGTITVD